MGGEPAVGGTKTVDIDRIFALKPDLVIASREENTKEQVEALAEHLPVFVVDVNSYVDALRAVRDLGELTGRPEQAAALADCVDGAFYKLQPLAPPVTTAYLVWREPHMAVGGNTYIDSLMRRCGLANVCPAGDKRYPQIALAELARLSPRLVLLGSEPYPFDHADADEIRAVLPEAHVLLVDGEMFAWYGARMREAAGYLARLTGQIRRELTGD